MKNHKILKISYWISIICLIHCISLPLLVALLPFLNIVLEINPFIELVLLGSVIIFGSYSLLHAYFNHHKNILPLLLFIVGVGLSLFLHFGMHNHSHSNILGEIFSGLLIAGSQFWNLKLTPKSCSH